MILYRSNTAGFIDEVDRNVIVDQIDTAYIKGMGRRAGDGERRAWNNSMRFMETIVRKSEIPDDCGILIEYNIPTTSKRIDFVITGHDENDSSNFLIIELKQWESAESTDKEALVRTYLNNGIRETTHPAYQAYSYKKYFSDMNSAVYEGDIRAVSCAYLHNYQKKNPEPLLQEQYKEIVEDTPVFFSSDAEKLEDFVKRYVGKGKGLEILFKIENGKIAPSKKFVDYVADVFEGNPVYTLLDEQKVAYSDIVDISLKTKNKTAIIVNGGPGTGKSVVAMNAFVTLLEKRLNVRFVAPNASFRECMVDTLGKQSSATKKRLKALFSGSGSFVHSYENEFDVLICDEAHRLKKKGAFMYSGESQVEDVIKASRVSVFFVDDNQMIRPDDEGSVARIKEVCAKNNVDVEEVKLIAQFRCSGAEGYLNWVDHTLQIQDTGNYDGWDEGAYDFKIFDDPNEMYVEICKRNDDGFKARMLAGFAWSWTDVKSGNDDAQKNDVTIPECDFSMPWNSRKDQYTWATDENKKNQIGCIHTSQGLEFDYVGVIIGNDLRFDEENHTVYASFDDYRDTAGRKGMKTQADRLSAYVKRIYKVLMSRGMKGCYVYSRDEKLREYLKERSK
mgnify:CR=1 FL=1